MEAKQPTPLFADNTSSLDDDARLRLAEMRGVDIVIGIPSHRNGRTIGDVLRAIGRGVAEYMPDLHFLLINADGGSSDNTAHVVMDTPLPENMVKLMTTYVGTMGRGTAVRAILEACALTHAKACLVLDARIPGIRPIWIKRLIQPILEGNDLTIGTYERSPYAAAFNDNVVYPFLKAFLHVDLRNPLPYEVCLAGEYAAELISQDVWETDVAKFGANMFIVLEALIAQRRILQVELGYRGDPSGEPGAMADPRLLHVISTLFRFLTTYHRLWCTNLPVKHIPVASYDVTNEDLHCPECIPQLIGALKVGSDLYKREWGQILTSKDITRIQGICDMPVAEFEFPLELWIRVLLRFAFVYNCGEGDPDKVAEAFLPLYYGRAASFIKETLSMTPEERERTVEQVAKAMSDAKPAFTAIWQERPFWTDPSWF
ncbi:MAG: glycosyltransferase family protein [Anaerolineae bacterium]